MVVLMTPREASWVAECGANGFGYWLAGFVDGEGSFNIRRASRTHRCMDTAFTIFLRDDDSPILIDTQLRLGIGRIVFRSNVRSGNARPVVGWNVQSLDDCWRLCLLFDAFPLRAKKAGDYEIWRRAVALRKSWPRNSHRSFEDWAELESLRDELRDYREYR